MESKRLRHDLSLVYIRTSMKGKYAVTELADKHGVTLMQALVLCLLEPRKAVPMKSLSNFLRCDPSNITPIIEQLVIQGYVLRREAVHDRRVKTITVTDEGIALREQVLDLSTKARMPNLDTLSSREVTQLITLLEKATQTNSHESIAAHVEST